MAQAALKEVIAEVRQPALGTHLTFCRPMLTDSQVEIYCPSCHWEPDGHAHWQCTCGYVWNSFETAAVCPKCQFRWKISQCPTIPGGCGVVSPHVDWYHGLAGLVEELVAESEAVTAPA